MEKDMRVLHINLNYTGTALHQLMIEKLDKMGYDNRVFVPIYNGTESVIVPNKNVLVCECFNKWDRVIFDLKQFKICNALQSNINIEQFNLIHAYTLFTDGNCARTVSKKYGIPYVVAVRNTDVYDFFRLMPHLRHRGIKVLLDAQAVFFLSEAYRKQLFEKYIPEKYHAEINEKTFIIPNGIDDFWIENYPENENILGSTIRLIYAGRIDKNKNIVTTQKAIRILRQRGYDVSLTVVGKVTDQKVFEIIKNDPHTTCLSAKPKEELIDVYRSHNIFVMPSFTESFGLVYAEAMSQGLPVVYSVNQGFDKQFPEGEVGYHVSPYDVNDVADGIEKVIKNFDVIKNNVVKSAKKFNWEHISLKYDEIYKRQDS